MLEYALYTQCKSAYSKSIVVASVFFSTNVTSWKQPCNLGVIAAFKKNYKILILKKKCSFYPWAEQLQPKITKKEGSKYCRGSVGFHYSKPAALLNVANYAKETWEKILIKLLKVPFLKADLKISLNGVVTETFGKNNLFSL